MAEYSDRLTNNHQLVRRLLLAAHPVPAAVVTALGTALAALSGQGAGRCLLAGAAVLAGQLSIGWCNDLVDRRRDRTVGRRDKPLATGLIGPVAVARAAGTALALCVPLSLAGGLGPGLAHLTAVGAAWAYNLGVKRTVWSWLPYAVGFGLLPVYVTAAAAPAWLIAGSALLGVGAHFANVLPDIGDDRATGVRGLPQRLGPVRTRALAVLLPALASVVVAGWPGLGLSAAVLFLLRRRPVFVAVMVLAAADLAALGLRLAT